MLIAQNKILKGRVLYQSSGNKPAVGVRIAEPDATAVFSLNNGDYLLKFQSKGNGSALALEIGNDNAQKQKIELVNEKEVKNAKLPDSPDAVFDIIVCPAGQRDMAAQKYYRILRTTADRELEKKRKEVEGLLAQQEKDYQKISDLFAQLDQMQAALDSAKIREQAFNIASINLDRASQLVKDAVKKIEEENDVEGALRILSVGALDTAYQLASANKKQADAIFKKADAGIQQVVEGYEFKINLLEPRFKYGEMAECYEKIVRIYEQENYDQEKLADYLIQVAKCWRHSGVPHKAIEFSLRALAIREKVLPHDHPDLAEAYNNIALTYHFLGEYQKQLEFNLRALAIREKNLPANHPDLAVSYDNMSRSYSDLGDYQKQLDYSLKAIAINEKALKVDDPDLAQSYNNVATSYANLGDYENTLNFLQKSLAIYEKVFPPDHPELAVTYNNLAATYGNLYEPQKALEFALKAVVIQEKILPADHPDLAIFYGSVAYCYGDLFDQQKELEFDLKMLAIQEKNLPVNHPDLVISYNNVSVVYRDIGEYEKGIEYGLKSARIGESLDPKSPILYRVYANLGITYIKNHNFFDAKACFEKSERLKPDERVYRGWAMYYALQNDTPRALENLQKAVELGYKDLKWIETDESLESIRGELLYKELVEKLKKK